MIYIHCYGWIAKCHPKMVLVLKKDLLEPEGVSESDWIKRL